METKFEIQMSTGAMYRFLMYHGYHEFSGIFSILAGAALIVFYFAGAAGTANRWIYLFFGILFLVYQPWSFYTRAARQVKLSTVFKKPLAYTLTEDGITVTQEEASTLVEWNTICKVRETKQSIFVYTSARNAHIWIKEQMGGQEEAVRRMLDAHVSAKKIKWKR